MPLLNVQDLSVGFHTRHGVVRAVNHVSFSLEPGDSLGIVGESGSGKSVTCLSLLGLLPMPPARIESGAAAFDGQDLLRLPAAKLRGILGRDIAMIFQDPMTSLNPYLRIATQLTEPLLVHKGLSRAAAFKQAAAALGGVGIADPEARLNQYPHEFSGGMRQRVMIAMATITRPRLLIADEPTTALDVTVQAQILELIKTLRREHGTAVIFITHNLAVINGIADRVMVMYAGQAVETAPVPAIFHQPLHPYTAALLRSVPSAHKPGEPLQSILGTPPDPLRLPPGCPFTPRCPFAQEPCSLATTAELELGPVPSPAPDRRLTACIRVKKEGADVLRPA